MRYYCEDSDDEDDCRKYSDRGEDYYEGIGSYASENEKSFSERYEEFESGSDNHQDYIVIEPDSELETEDYKESEEEIYEYGYRGDESYQEYGDQEEEYPVWNNEGREDYDDEERSQWKEERRRETIEALRKGYAECGIDKNPRANPVYEEHMRTQIKELYERIRQLQEICERNNRMKEGYRKENEL